MSMPHPAVALRRLVARRPIVYWLAVAALGVTVVLAVASEVHSLRTERDRWSDTSTVLVARSDGRPGELIAVDAIDLPDAVAPASAIGAIDGRPLRRHVAAGDIVTELDLAPRSGSLALVPPGWRAVPIVEVPSSASEVGDRVEVVSDGVVIASEAVVVGGHDSVTLVAVPADVAPLLPLAASSSSVALLRVP